MEEIQYLVVHHSASNKDVKIEEIRQWHLDKGWSDIGYHLVIEHDGLIRHGRKIPQQGAHARGVNQVSIGVCLVGDNRHPETMWSSAQWTAMTRLISACRLFWPKIKVRGHREVGTTATECPGMDLDMLRSKEEEA